MYEQLLSGTDGAKSDGPGHWVFPKPNDPTNFDPVQGARMVGYNGKLWLWGGRKQFNAISSKDWYVYTPATDTWETITAPATAPASRAKFTLIVDGDYFYMFAGDSADLSIWRYEPATNLWTSTGSYSRGGSAVYSALNGVSAYRYEPDNSIRYYGGQAMGSNEPSQGWFTQDAYIQRTYTKTGGMGGVQFSLNYARQHAEGVAYKNDFYQIGGQGAATGPQLSDMTKIATTNTWTTIKMPLIKGRVGHNVMQIGKRMYVFGGMSGLTGPSVFNDLWVVDLETHVPTELAPGPNRGYGAAAELDGKLWFIGGWANQADINAFKPTHNFQCYIPDIQEPE